MAVGIVAAALAVLAAVVFLHHWSASPVIISAVGDTSGYRILGESEAPADPLAALRPLIGESDMFLFNYEGVILAQSPEPGDCPAQAGQSTFYTATAIAGHLALAPVNIATLANNHVLDCGERAIADTVSEFAAAGIHTVGAGTSLESACRPLVLEWAGRKLAFLAYLAWPDDAMCATEDSAGAACFDSCGGEQRIAALSASGHTVVASLHLHLAESWTQQPHDSHVRLVRDVLEAGADVVVGHGPHMPQGVLEMERGIGFPSLGNFLFKTDYRMPLEAYRSVIARLTIGDGLPVASLYPVEIGADGIPYPAPANVADGILHEIAWLSEPFGARLEIVRDEEYVSAELRR